MTRAAAGSRRRIWLQRGLVGLLLIALGLTLFVWRRGVKSGVSTCLGSPARGALQNGWRLPRAGANFRAYSDVSWALGRTFVHSAVHEVVVKSYEGIANSHPELRFVYGETGFARGGHFKPHRTHQNGLSVDFLVPVRDAAGEVRELPTSVFDKFGYALEFDDTGKLQDLQIEIDFAAIAAHLAELQRVARSRHVRIVRVIFDPTLRDQLAKTAAWSEIANLPFMQKPAWIRHDEHYHVDFEVACRAFP